VNFAYLEKKSGSNLDEKLVVMDVMESPIERPKKRQKQFLSGKQKELTLKTQLVINQKSSQIVCLVNGLGKTHDFKLFKNSGVKFGTLMKVLADKGYPGITLIHPNCETPIKKHNGKKLSKDVIIKSLGGVPANFKTVKKICYNLWSSGLQCSRKLVSQA